MGSIGVFPSNYVTKLAPREKPLQCRAPVNINSVHGDGIIELLRDQVKSEKRIHTVILQDWTLEKWALSSFTFQSF